MSGAHCVHKLLNCTKTHLYKFSVDVLDLKMSILWTERTGIFKIQVKKCTKVFMIVCNIQSYQKDVHIMD